MRIKEVALMMSGDGGGEERGGAEGHIMNVISESAQKGFKHPGPFEYKVY